MSKRFLNWDMCKKVGKVLFKVVIDLKPGTELCIKWLIYSHDVVLYSENKLVSSSTSYTSTFLDLIGPSTGNCYTYMDLEKNEFLSWCYLKAI